MQLQKRYQHKYIQNNQGLTLLEVLVALALTTIVLSLGYNLLRLTIVTTAEQTKQAEELLQIDHFNRLLLEDIHHAKDVALIDNSGVLSLTYTSNKTSKKVTFTPTEEGLYDLDYTIQNKTTPSWIQLKQHGTTIPIKYNPTAKSITYDFFIGSIPIDYTVYLRSD